MTLQEIYDLDAAIKAEYKKWNDEEGNNKLETSAPTAYTFIRQFNYCLAWVYAEQIKQDSSDQKPEQASSSILSEKTFNSLNTYFKEFKLLNDALLEPLEEDHSELLQGLQQLGSKIAPIVKNIEKASNQVWNKTDNLSDQIQQALAKYYPIVRRGEVIMELTMAVDLLNQAKTKLKLLEDTVKQFSSLLIQTPISIAGKLYMLIDRAVSALAAHNEFCNKLIACLEALDILAENNVKQFGNLLRAQQNTKKTQDEYSLNISYLVFAKKEPAFGHVLMPSMPEYIDAFHRFIIYCDSMDNINSWITKIVGLRAKSDRIENPLTDRATAQQLEKYSHVSGKLLSQFNQSDREQLFKLHEQYQQAETLKIGMLVSKQLNLITITHLNRSNTSLLLNAIDILNCAVAFRLIEINEEYVKFYDLARDQIKKIGDFTLNLINNLNTTTFAEDKTKAVLSQTLTDTCKQLKSASDIMKFITLTIDELILDSSGVHIFKEETFPLSIKKCAEGRKILLENINPNNSNPPLELLRRSLEVKMKGTLTSMRIHDPFEFYKFLTTKDMLDDFQLMIEAYSRDLRQYEYYDHAQISDEEFKAHIIRTSKTESELRHTRKNLANYLNTITNNGQGLQNSYAKRFIRTICEEYQKNIDFLIEVIQQPLLNDKKTVDRILRSIEELFEKAEDSISTIKQYIEHILQKHMELEPIENLIKRLPNDAAKVSKDIERQLSDNPGLVSLFTKMNYLYTEVYFLQHLFRDISLQELASLNEGTLAQTVKDHISNKKPHRIIRIKETYEQLNDTLRSDIFYKKFREVSRREISKVNDYNDHIFKLKYCLESIQMPMTFPPLLFSLQPYRRQTILGRLNDHADQLSDAIFDQVLKKSDELHEKIKSVSSELESILTDEKIIHFQKKVKKTISSLKKETEELLAFIIEQTKRPPLQTGQIDLALSDIPTTEDDIKDEKDEKTETTKPLTETQTTLAERIDTIHTLLKNYSVFFKKILDIDISITLASLEQIKKADDNSSIGAFKTNMDGCIEALKKAADGCMDAITKTGQTNNYNALLKLHDDRASLRGKSKKIVNSQKRLNKQINKKANDIKKVLGNTATFLKATLYEQTKILERLIADIDKQKKPASSQSDQETTNNKRLIPITELIEQCNLALESVRAHNEQRNHKIILNELLPDISYQYELIETSISLIILPEALVQQPDDEKTPSQKDTILGLLQEHISYYDETYFNNTIEKISDCIKTIQSSTMRLNELTVQIISSEPYKEYTNAKSENIKNQIANNEFRPIITELLQVSESTQKQFLSTHKKLQKIKSLLLEKDSVSSLATDEIITNALAEAATETLAEIDDSSVQLITGPVEKAITNNQVNINKNVFTDIREHATQTLLTKLTESGLDEYKKRIQRQTENEMLEFPGPQTIFTSVLIKEVVEKSVHKITNKTIININNNIKSHLKDKLIELKLTDQIDAKITLVYQEIMKERIKSDCSNYLKTKMEAAIRSFAKGTNKDFTTQLHATVTEILQHDTANIADDLRDTTKQEAKNFIMSELAGIATNHDAALHKVAGKLIKNPDSNFTNSAVDRIKNSLRELDSLLLHHAYDQVFFLLEKYEVRILKNAGDQIKQHMKKLSANSEEDKKAAPKEIQLLQQRRSEAIAHSQSIILPQLLLEDGTLNPHFEDTSELYLALMSDNENKQDQLRRELHAQYYFYNVRSGVSPSTGLNCALYTLFQFATKTRLTPGQPIPREFNTQAEDLRKALGLKTFNEIGIDVFALFIPQLKNLRSRPTRILMFRLSPDAEIELYKIYGDDVGPEDTYYVLYRSNHFEPMWPRLGRYIFSNTRDSSIDVTPALKIATLLLERFSTGDTDKEISTRIETHKDELEDYYTILKNLLGSRIDEHQRIVDDKRENVPDLEPASKINDEASSDQKENILEQADDNTVISDSDISLAGDQKTEAPELTLPAFTATGELNPKGLEQLRDRTFTHLEQQQTILCDEPRIELPLKALLAGLYHTFKPVLAPIRGKGKKGLCLYGGQISQNLLLTENYAQGRDTDCFTCFDDDKIARAAETLAEQANKQARTDNERVRHYIAYQVIKTILQLHGIEEPKEEDIEEFYPKLNFKILGNTSDYSNIKFNNLDFNLYSTTYNDANNHRFYYYSMQAIALWFYFSKQREIKELRPMLLTPIPQQQIILDIKQGRFVLVGNKESFFYLLNRLQRKPKIKSIDVQTLPDYATLADLQKALEKTKKTTPLHALFKQSLATSLYSERHINKLIQQTILHPAMTDETIGKTLHNHWKTLLHNDFLNKKYSSVLEAQDKDDLINFTDYVWKTLLKNDVVSMTRKKLNDFSQSPFKFMFHALASELQAELKALRDDLKRYCRAYLYQERTGDIVFERNIIKIMGQIKNHQGLKINEYTIERLKEITEQFVDAHKKTTATLNKESEQRHAALASKLRKLVKAISTLYEQALDDFIIANQEKIDRLRNQLRADMPAFDNNNQTPDTEIMAEKVKILLERPFKLQHKNKTIETSPGNFINRFITELKNDNYVTFGLFLVGKQVRFNCLLRHNHAEHFPIQICIATTQLRTRAFEPLKLKALLDELLRGPSEQQASDGKQEERQDDNQYLKYIVNAGDKPMIELCIYDSISDLRSINKDTIFFSEDLLTIELDETNGGLAYKDIYSLYSLKQRNISEIIGQIKELTLEIIQPQKNWLVPLLARLQLTACRHLKIETVIAEIPFTRSLLAMQEITPSKDYEKFREELIKEFVKEYCWIVKSPKFSRNTFPELLDTIKKNYQRDIDAFSYSHGNSKKTAEDKNQMQQFYKVLLDWAGPELSSLDKFDRKQAHPPKKRSKEEEEALEKRTKEIKDIIEKIKKQEEERAENMRKLMPLEVKSSDNTRKDYDSIKAQRDLMKGLLTKNNEAIAKLKQKLEKIQAPSSTTADQKEITNELDFVPYEFNGTTFKQIFPTPKQIDHARGSIKRLYQDSSTKRYSKILYLPKATQDIGPRDEVLNTLLDEIQWEDKRLPRQTAYYADSVDLLYPYSGISNTPRTWDEAPPLMLEIKALVEQITGDEFNAVFINWYKDNKQGIGAHADAEPEIRRHRRLGGGRSIVSLSFGDERPFIFLDKKDFEKEKYTEVLRVDLGHGDFIWMLGVQDILVHQVPKEWDIVRKDRINFTFRQILTRKQISPQGTMSKNEIKNINERLKDKAEALEDALKNRKRNDNYLKNTHRIITRCLKTIEKEINKITPRNYDDDSNIIYVLSEALKNLGYIINWPDKTDEERNELLEEAKDNLGV